MCETEQQFADAYGQQLDEPLALDELPDGVEAVGLSYVNTLSSKTVALLARVDGQQVIVFADLLKRDSKPKLPADSELHLHRRELGSLVLYELSPLPEMRVAPLLRRPWLRAATPVP